MRRDVDALDERLTAIKAHVRSLEIYVGLRGFRPGDPGEAAPWAAEEHYELTHRATTQAEEVLGAAAAEWRKSGIDAQERASAYREESGGEAAELGFWVGEVEADWAKHGKAAGPIRNRALLDRCPDLVIAFPGGKGTADMVGEAKRRGIAVRLIDEPPLSGGGEREENPDG